MPGEVISEVNPLAMPSHLPGSVMELAAKIPQRSLDKSTLECLKSFHKAACYFAGAMIFLRDNVLLERDLGTCDIKPRLLGHWGTCPGLILIWSHVNHLVQRHGIHTIVVVSPGHGPPPVLASFWIEVLLGKFYPEKYGVDKTGLYNFVTRFSVPEGFPSRFNAETPGAIHEEGDLGHALAVSFGAVMDRPDLLGLACLKYIDPAESGAVLPILHVNGFKISERTILGCMDDKELVFLFSGYGYHICIVETLDKIDQELFNAMEWAVGEIREKTGSIRVAYFEAEVDGEFIEGSFRSHQVPVLDAKKNPDHLRIVQDRLGSYGINALLKDGSPSESVLSTLPVDASKRLGRTNPAYDSSRPLNMPAWQEFGMTKDRAASSMKIAGGLLKQIAMKNPKTFRMFSSDEFENNKLNAILDASGRKFQFDQLSRAQRGHVIEILAKHCCQGFMQGYTLTGRMALFPSYESFLGIIHTTMAQYSKFNKHLGYNGFSHQKPSFIGAVLRLKAEAARVHLPPDGNCFLSTVNHCLQSKNKVNLMIGSKQPTAVYLTPGEAAKHCQKGAFIWKFASSGGDGEADVVVFVGVGVEVTFEIVKVAELLLQMAPDLRVRVVNVTDLYVLRARGTPPPRPDPRRLCRHV
ncbi:hypothetical protein MY1884_000601 [Beauveria asiatica]